MQMFAESYRRYLQAQGHFWPGFLAYLVASTSHIGTGYIFIVYFRFYEIGAAFASTISFSLLLITLILIAKLKGLDTKCRAPISFNNYCPNMKVYFKYMLPTLLNTFIVLGFYEISQLEASLLGENTQSAHIILVSAEGFFYMLPMGISFTMASVVGRAIGEGRPKKALLFIKASIFIITCIMIPIGMIMSILNSP